MRDKGLLTTRMSKRLLAGNTLRLNRVVIENHDFGTKFHPVNKLKKVLYPSWWNRQTRMQAARKLTQKRLTQPGQHERWWYEWFWPANKRTHLLGTSFDQSRLHNNQFNRADMTETTYSDGRWFQNDFVQTRLFKSVFDGLMALFTNMTDARVNGSSFENSRWVGLRADGLDARPHMADQNLDDLTEKPQVTPTRLNGIKITKVGQLQKPEMWVRALSKMRHAQMQNSDWQGADIDGLDVSHSNMNDANIQDTVWKGTVHNGQNFKRLRLRPQPGRTVRFEPSVTAPFRTPEAKSAEKELKQWEKKVKATAKLSGEERNQAKQFLLNNKPPDPEDYCQFVNADLSGKNMAGVEIRGMRLKGAYASYINLKQALVNGITVQTIMVNPQNHKKEVEILTEILKDIRYNANQPPILDQTKTIKARSISDNEAQGFKAKHQLAKQKSAQQQESLLKSVQSNTLISGGTP